MNEPFNNALMGAGSLYGTGINPQKVIKTTMSGYTMLYITILGL
jgi:hypothetical protein